MKSVRQCSHSACSKQAVATLTYVYADSTAVLGPLSAMAEPHSYDLCATHAQRITAPRGWEIIRLEPDFVDAGPTPDDLVALAEAVRERGQHSPEAPAVPLKLAKSTRYGHLRVIESSD